MSVVATNRVLRALFVVALGFALIVATTTPSAFAAEGNPPDAELPPPASVTTIDPNSPGAPLADSEAAEMDQAIAEAEQALAVATGALAELSAERTAVETDLVAAEQELADATDAQRKSQQELAVLNHELDVRREIRDRERRKLQGQARESWKRATGGTAQGIEGTLGIIDDADSPREAMRNLDALRYLMNRQAGTVDTLEDLTAKVEASQTKHLRLVRLQADAERQAQERRDEMAELTDDVRTLETQAEEAIQAKAGLLDMLVSEKADRDQAQLDLMQSVDALVAGMISLRGGVRAPVELLAYGNGQVPTDVLAPIGFGGHRLWQPAAEAFTALVADAEADGIAIGVTDSYRRYEMQVDVARRKGLYSEGGLAARPGTSNHGWGLALDLILDDEAQAWMRANANRYFFFEDTPREPWHWVYYSP